MKLKQTALVIALIGLCATGAYALYTQTENNVVFYYEVDEYLSDPALQESPRTRVSGVVREGSVAREAEEMRIMFAVQGTDEDLKVEYTGPVPDIFQPGVQVVIEGERDRETGVFMAESLLAKCPSKYQKEGKEEDFMQVEQHPMDPNELKY